MVMSLHKPVLESLRCADTPSSLPSSCTAGGNTCVPLYVLCPWVPYIVLVPLRSFLNLCNQYGLLSEDAQAAARLDGQQPLDQNTRRLQKVQRFKREREIKAKLGSMQMKQMRIAQLQDEVCSETMYLNGLMSFAVHAAYSVYIHGAVYTEYVPVLFCTASISQIRS